MENCHFQFELILYMVIGLNRISSLLYFFWKIYHVLLDFILPVDIGENLKPMCQDLNPLYCREKEKNKQREDNWCKVQNLAMGNPQVSI